MYEHACCEGLSQSRLGVALRPWVSFAAMVRVFQVCCKQKGVCFAVAGSDIPFGSPWGQSATDTFASAFKDPTGFAPRLEIGRQFKTRDLEIHPDYSATFVTSNDKYVHGTVDSGEHQGICGIGMATNAGTMDRCAKLACAYAIGAKQGKEGIQPSCHVQASMDEMTLITLKAAKEKGLPIRLKSPPF